jgi:hypothetical protein
MASTLNAGTATIERIDTARWTGTGVYLSQQSDTPSAGNAIKRKVYYKNEFGSTDAFGTWTLIHEFADDTSYASALTYINDKIIAGQTNGTAPASLVMTWEDTTSFTGLLDDYPGAAAAYSLRLLNSTYTGSAIRVRRASDNAEQDIGFDNNELDTSTLATFCFGTNGFVKTWYDQSGNANHATQTTTGSQPKIYDSITGVVTENGKPALDFDGVNDSFALTASVSAIASDYSFFIVIEKAVDNSWTFDSAIGRIIIDTPNSYAYFDGTAARGNPITTGNQDLQSYFLISTGGTTALNGSVQQTGLGYTQRKIGGNTRIGCDNNNSQRYMTASLQEFLIYTNDQSSNRTGIETNINDFYSIF